MCEICKRYSEDQPRDPDGKFASGGGGSYSELYDSQKELHAGLSKTERDALFFWSGPGYFSFNTFLRNPEEYKDGFSNPHDADVQGRLLQGRITALDAAIDRSSTSASTTLYRAVDFPLSVGQTITDKGYAAFSADKAWGDRLGDKASIIEVTFPAGSKCFTLPDDVSFDSGKEKEVLTPRDGAFVITGVREDAGKRYYTASTKSLG